MKVSPYLSFNGDCEAAFRFYAQCLGGTVGELFRYGGSPMEEEAPPGWRDKVMHGSVKVGGQVLLGADVVPDRYEQPRGISLSIELDRTAEAERIFGELAANGQVMMPLEKTFWAERFGVVQDRFRITWLINCDAAG